MSITTIGTLGATTNTSKKMWNAPDIILSQMVEGTEKLSSTQELFVPTFNRTLGPS